MTSKRRRSKAKLFALLAIILLAAFYRLVQINTIPPGDGHDPAYYGLDALQILDGELPVFFPSNFGREALFSYLVAAFVALFGAGPLAVHLTSAFIGILTIPAVFLVVEELFGEEEGALGQLGGLLAALATAISYWHLHWSRFGVRVILVPLVVALAIYCVWRGLRTNSKGYMIATGILLGLGMYTYQAARILPLLIVLAFLYAAISQRSLTKVDLLNLAVVSLVALLVFAPLGVYFLNHPGTFGQRIEQTLVLDAAQGISSNVQAVWKQLLAIPSVLFFQGEGFPTHGLVNRPALDTFLSALFLLGVLVSLLRIKRLPYFFLLTWLVVMAAPAFLSQHGSVAKRVIGTLPAIMALIAIGALAPWDVLRRWSTRQESDWKKAIPTAAGIVLVAGFVLSAVTTYQDYFVVWAGDPDMFTHFEVGLTAIGKYARTLPPGQRVYISPGPADHPSVVYNAQNRPGIKSYDGRICLVLPGESSTDTTFVIVLGEDPQSLDLLHTYFPQGEIVAEGPLHYQLPYFYAFDIPAGATVDVRPSYSLDVIWGNAIRLLGYDVDSLTYQPGDTIKLTLYYQALNEVGADYTFFAHLLGPADPEAGGPMWGQIDNQPCGRAYPTSVWTPGEIVRDQLSIGIPMEAPPGDYEIKVGFYLLETMVRLPALDADGLPISDDAVPLLKIRVEGGDDN